MCWRACGACLTVFVRAGKSSKQDTEPKEDDAQEENGIPYEVGSFLLSLSFFIALIVIKFSFLSGRYPKFTDQL